MQRAQPVTTLQPNDTLFVYPGILNTLEAASALAYLLNSLPKASTVAGGKYIIASRPDVPACLAQYRSITLVDGINLSQGGNKVIASLDPAEMTSRNARLLHCLIKSNPGVKIFSDNQLYPISIPSIEFPKEESKNTILLMKLTSPFDLSQVSRIDPANTSSKTSGKILQKLVDTYILVNNEQGFLSTESIYPLRRSNGKIIFVQLPCYVSRYKRKNRKAPAAPPSYRYALSDSNVGDGSMGSVFLSRKTLRPQSPGVFTLWDKRPEKWRVMKKVSGSMVTSLQKTINAQQALGHEVTLTSLFPEFAVNGPLHDISNNESMMLGRYFHGFDLMDVLQYEIEHRIPLLTVKARAQLSELLFRGLKRIHDAGVIHRDVKPENIRLVLDQPPAKGAKVQDIFKSGTLKVRNPVLFDFGLSKQRTYNDKGEGCGTPHYVASECWNREATDCATDLTALGRSLWALWGSYYLFTFPNVSTVRNFTVNPKTIDKIPFLFEHVKISDDELDPYFKDKIHELFIGLDHPDMSKRPTVDQAIALFAEIADKNEERLRQRKQPPMSPIF